MYLPQVYGAMILEDYGHMFSRIRFMGDLCEVAEDGVLYEEDFLQVCEEWAISIDIAMDIYKILLAEGVFHFGHKMAR